MVLAAVLIRTDFVGPDGQWVRYNGQADLRTQSDLEPQALDLPAGSRQIEIRGSFLTVTSEDVVGATADGDDRQRVMLEVSDAPLRSEEHTSELQSLMRISYAVSCF